MKPSTWGPPTWIAIHFICLGYLPENKAWYAQYFESLPHVIPCDKCREHLKANLLSLPPDFEHGPDGLFAWSVAIHNLVNSQLGKEQMPLDVALDLYRNMSFEKGGVGSNKRRIINWVVGVCFLAFLLMVAAYLLRKDVKKIKR